MINKIIVMLLVVTSFGVSCSNETINEPSYEDLINNAILNDARSDDNKNQDKERKPAEIIKFAELNVIRVLRVEEVATAKVAE